MISVTIVFFIKCTYLVSYSSFSLHPTQECRANPGVNEISDQRSEADIGEKMVGHVDAVVGVLIIRKQRSFFKQKNG
jgi:hypothetical protein